MANRGIGVQGVTSQIGVMKAFAKIFNSKYRLQRKDLREAICYRFDATKEEAVAAIDSAISTGIIIVRRGCVIMNQRQKK